MKNILSILLIVAVMLTTSPGYSSDITPLQMFFVAKQIFAEKKVAYILIDQRTFKEAETAMKRASAQTQLELKVFLIGGKIDIGNAFKEIDDNSLLIIFDSKFLNESSNKLYILSKCKDRHISIITSSDEYGKSGALLTVFTDSEGKTKIKLNLQKNEDQKDYFTEELIKNSGISEVLM